MQPSTDSIVTLTPLGDPNTYSPVVFHLSEQPHEYVVIEAGVEDYPLLLTEVHPNREVVVLHPQEDGIQPILNSVTAFLRAIYTIQHWLRFCIWSPTVFRVFSTGATGVSVAKPYRVNNTALSTNGILPSLTSLASFCTAHNLWFFCCYGFEGC